MEESEGFEPSVPLPALRISSATLSTTQPTLLAEAEAPSRAGSIWQPPDASENGKLSKCTEKRIG